MSIEKTDYFTFIQLIEKFPYINIETILPDQFDAFLSEYMTDLGELQAEVFFEEMLEVLEDADKFTYIAGSLFNEDYFEFIDSQVSLDAETRKKLKKRDNAHFKIIVQSAIPTIEYKSVYLIDLYKIKLKGKRKTKEELEFDLEDAVNVENYELAAKIREKINKLKKKK